MNIINCTECNRAFEKRKSTRGNICGICNSKIKRKEEQLINLETERYRRYCPICNIKIVYKNKRRYLKSTESNCNCKKCTALQQLSNLNLKIKNGLAKNGFSGKSHSLKTKSKISLRNTGNKHSIESIKKISDAAKKRWKDNPDFNFYDSWVNKYGKKIADKKLRDFSYNISNRNSGSGNPMYGKPSPQGSGNGWSGWYKDEYFRSLHELCFLVNWIDRFKMEFKSAETKEFKIQYTFNDKERNYFADYIINNKYLIEVKPKKLWNTPQNAAKFKAAREYCKNNKLIFKVIDPGRISKEILIQLYETSIVKFNSTYTKKINELKNK